MDLWTKAEKKPPKDTCHYYIHNPEVRESLSSMITILTTAANIGSNHPLWAQIKVFRFMQNRLSSKVSCSHFLPVFERIGRVVQKMVLVDLSKLYTDFADKFLKGLARSSAKIKLPSRTHLEYILIRTQASAKLLCETLSYARNIFCYLVTNLSDGPDFHAILSACSVVKKISTYFKGLLLQVCNMYLKVKPCLERLETGRFEWGWELNLPDDLWFWCRHQEAFDINEEVLPDDKIKLMMEMLQKSNIMPTRKENVKISAENEQVEKNCFDVEIEVIDIEEPQLNIINDSVIEVFAPRKEDKETISNEVKTKNKKKKKHSKVFNSKNEDKEFIEVKTKKKKKKRRIEVIELETEDERVSSNGVRKVKKKKKRQSESSSKISQERENLEEVILTEGEVKKKKKKRESSNPKIEGKKKRKLERALFKLKNDILNARTFESLSSIWKDIETECISIKHKDLSPLSATKLKKLFNKLRHHLKYNAEEMKNVRIEAFAALFAKHLVLEFNGS